MRREAKGKRARRGGQQGRNGGRSTRPLASQAPQCVRRRSGVCRVCVVCVCVSRARVAGAEGPALPPRRAADHPPRR
eukprot:6207088-Pleurochrysis_carterae.AAC.1